MNTGCKDCDRNLIDKQDLCPKHKLECLKWAAENAQNEYIAELKAQSRKGTKIEREQNAKL